MTGIKSHGRKASQNSVEVDNNSSMVTFDFDGDCDMGEAVTNVPTADVRAQDARKKSQLDLYKQKKQAPVFADAETMKEKVREAILKPEVNVQKFYKDSGWCQAIARSPYFEHLT